MAPSRGLLGAVMRAKIPPKKLSSHSTFFARCASSFAETLANPANRVQSYRSRSNDPFVNLSIEDYILRKSPADSTVLFLYTNRPCIVIGRNQNPWSEVNLPMLLPGAPPPAIGPVDLVRRRSGGGTVFHDEGNVNWSITCPRADFTRDKYAEMVVRALRSMRIERARVNERHDIVLDQGKERRAVDPQDTHRTAYTVEEGGPRALKVSGSAYKLTRARALHHATTLLASPNLKTISHYLRSPARDFIQAKGVESVSSPVANIGLDVELFQECLQREFATSHVQEGVSPVVDMLGEDLLNIPEIKKGYDELKTGDWMWSQTPQFNLVVETITGANIGIDVKRGVIQAVEAKDAGTQNDVLVELQAALVGQNLQDIGDWTGFLQSRIVPFGEHYEVIAHRLETLLCAPQSLRL